MRYPLRPGCGRDVDEARQAGMTCPPTLIGLAPMLTGSSEPLNAWLNIVEHEPVAILPGER